MANRFFAAIRLAALVGLAVTAGSRWMVRAETQPEIKITEVPPARPGNPDEMHPIAGVVSGVVFRDHRVVIYAQAGDRWWVQPFDYAALTEIRSSGKFETETHPGAIYAALLVTSAYRPKPTMHSLPEVGGEVVARYRVTGRRD